MKIRNGFVSNSSSSSFVVAFTLRKTKPCDCCGRTDPDFEEVCFKWREFRETELVANGYEEIVRVFSDTEQVYLDISDVDMEKLRGELNKYQGDDWKLMFFDIDYDDALAESVLYNLLESKNAILLYDEENKYKGKYHNEE